MKISRECIHCLARQAVEIAEEATSSEAMQEEIIKKSLQELGQIDFNETAPEIGFRMHQHAKNITGINDPYKGQANFETLSDIKNKTIFYLLRAKCSSVASAIGCKRMDYVLTNY